jgi:hypothetical protein
MYFLISGNVSWGMSNRVPMARVRQRARQFAIHHNICEVVQTTADGELVKRFTVRIVR